MSPRPPPKISLKHDWKRELGSEHAQRPEAGQLSGSFQSNQPTLNPIRERSGRPDITHDVIGVQDERKTSRSQEIDVNSFCKEPSSSERTGRPVETHVIQTRSSEDRKDFNVKQAHERTERPVITHDVINVSDSSQTRSARESERFNVGEETLRKRTESSIAYYDVSRDSIMVNEADMDFRNPRLPHSVVKHAQSTSVRELIQKIENLPDRHALQQDLRQNQSFDSFSPESKQMLQDVGNIELCELLETEPETQCTVCFLSGTLVYSTARAGISCIMKKGTHQEFINYTMDLLSVPQYVIKKGRPHGHRYGKKPGDREYASGSITCASGSLSLASASWKQFSRLQKAFCFCEKLTLCSTSFQSMKRQPAVRCCGLSAFCAAVCTNENSSCRSTAVLESRLTRSKLDDIQEELGEVFGHHVADRALEGAHVRPVQRLNVSREVPLDVAQFDVRPGVAHDAAKFCSNVLWRTIQNQEPGCELGVTRACVHVRVDRVDHVQESVLRDPVRRGVGHELARKVWSMRLYSVALLLMDDLCPHTAPHVCSKRDRDEGARGEDMGCFGPLGPPALACWNHAHSCLVQVPDAIL